MYINIPLAFSVVLMQLIFLFPFFFSLNNLNKGSFTIFNKQNNTFAPSKSLDAFETSKLIFFDTPVSTLDNLCLIN